MTSSTIASVTTAIDDFCYAVGTIPRDRYCATSASSAAASSPSN